MNSAYIKAKGREAENGVVEALKPYFEHVDRRPKHGTKDRGDIAGVPNTVIEVKDRAEMRLSTWLKELEVEMTNDEALTGVVVHKKKGTRDARRWYATMPFGLWIDLLVAALPQLRRQSEQPA